MLNQWKLTLTKHSSQLLILQEQKQIHQAPGYAHGGESQGTGVSSDHPCVDRIIELLEDVAENKRKREPDQLCRHALSA